MKIHVKNLSLEPYRPFFLVGSLAAIAMQAYWFWTLHSPERLAAAAALNQPIYQLQGQIHGHEMYYGIFAYFGFGFLLTAFPRFIEMPHPKPAYVMTWVAGLFLSQVAVRLGLHTPGFFYVGATLEIAVYATLLLFLTRLFRRSKATWREQPRLILFALTLGLIGSVLGHLALIHPDWQALRTLSVQTGLYGFILLMIFAITWRVVPFFSSRVLSGYVINRGKHTGRILLSLVIARLVLAGIPTLYPESLFDADPWCWAVDTLLAVTFISEIIRWQPWRARVFPPLFILYLGLTWLLVFLCLSPMHLVARFFLPSLDAWFYAHDRNLLHIFNLGTFGTLILAIASRVTRGHGGLPLTFDLFALLGMLLMQTAMVVRVLNIHGTMHYAALLWVVAFTLWAWRNIPILLSPPQGAHT